jgi:hypothetical protein
VGKRLIVGVAAATLLVLVAIGVVVSIQLGKVWRGVHYTARGALVQIRPPTYPEPKDNGFDALAKAVSALDPYAKAIEDAYDGPWDAGSAEITRLLAQCREPLAAAREALRKECLHPLPRSCDDEFPYLSDLRLASQLLILDGRRHELAGRPEEAAQRYAEVLALASATARNGSMIHSTIAVYIATSACQEVERCVGSGKMTDHALRALDARIAKALAERVPESETLAVEWVALDQYAEEVAAGRISLDGQPSQTAQANRATRMIADSGRAEINDVLGRAIEDARQPYWKRSQKDPEPRTLLGLMCLPTGFSALYTRCAERDALLEGLRVEIAVARHRAAEGRLPASLQALTPKYMDAMPPDPFDGQPLRYARRGSDYVLYSVGPNGKDEGGTQRIDWEAETGDLIIWPAGPVALPKPRVQGAAAKMPDPR